MSKKQMAKRAVLRVALPAAAAVIPCIANDPTPAARSPRAAQIQSFRLDIPLSDLAESIAPDRVDSCLESVTYLLVPPTEGVVDNPIYLVDHSTNEAVAYTPTHRR